MGHHNGILKSLKSNVNKDFPDNLSRNIETTILDQICVLANLVPCLLHQSKQDASPLDLSTLKAAKKQTELHKQASKEYISFLLLYVIFLQEKNCCSIH